MNPATGQLAAIATAFFWSATALFFSYSGRRIGSQVVNRGRLLFALLFVGLSHLALHGTVLPLDAEPYRWGWLSLSSVIGLVIGDTFLFYAYVLIGPRLSMLVMSLVPIINTAAGWLLFAEQISGWEMAGISLAVAGVAWVVTEPRREVLPAEQRQVGRGLLAAVGGAFGQALNLVTARYGLAGDFSTISATMIRLLVAVVVLWGLALLRGSAGPSLRAWRDRRAFSALVAGAVAGPFLGIWLSMVAVQQARLGIASTLMALPPVILIPVEFVIFRTPVSRRGVLGTLLAFSGVALIFLAPG
ncbi:MAG: DMT family transporter [Anaerolineae bacterium]|nr:DMT family transporter [Anaerolineae bacterium]